MNQRQELVNNILANWNPIEVPEEIAESEYSDYVDPIIGIGIDKTKLFEYLKSVLIDKMGLDFDESNEDHKDDLQQVCDKLNTALTESQA